MAWSSRQHLWAAALLLLSSLGGLLAAGGSQDDVPRVLELLKVRFRRPPTVPVPPDAVPTSALVALGQRLFFEKELSRSGRFACASCHRPEHGFADPMAGSVGEGGRPLQRHTPSLWNVAFGRSFFWDGRAATLEAQARFPIENPLEMGLPLGEATDRLKARPDYRVLFAEAFPERPKPRPELVLEALAAFERTLVSPPTRFDRWIEGDGAALGPSEVEGFLLFNGKAGCSRCHDGWRMSDDAYHDIGLSGADEGRGAILGLAEASHAFKPPSLRELAHTAPYMHDGRFARLDEVLDHYAQGVIARPSRSPDLTAIALSPPERHDLLAFLDTLSSAVPVQPIADLSFAPEALPPPVTTPLVRQRDRRFTPIRVRLAAGETLRIENDDTRLHNIRVHDPAFRYDSGAQRPGRTLEVAFPTAGSFLVFCGIHPTMRLTVEVAAPGGG